MARESKIEWTHATFNPWRGCTKISPGCTHCYAEVLAKRNPGVLGVWGPKGTRVVASDSYWRQPLKWDREAREAGERRRVFCCSLADVFEDRPELVEPRGRLLELIQHTPSLDWLLLTKRPEDVIRLWDQAAPTGMIYPMPNVWMGVSVENQAFADERIPILLRIPAAIRFLSVEPLLGPIECDLSGIDWCIIGGESGHGARPCDLAWVRSIRDQCQAAGIACFIKQLGGFPMDYDSPPGGLAVQFRDSKGGDWSEWPEDLRVREYPPPTHVPA